MSNNKDEKRDENQSWGRYIYNHRTGEILGRTVCSWGLILMFYLVFYGFLAAMFTLTMWVMLQTLDDNVPTYRDRVPSPGLVIRPRSMDISFNRSEYEQYGEYIRHLDVQLEPYNDYIQEQNELCLVDQYFEQKDEEVKKVCQFKRSLLRFCSGLDDPTFGYAEGKPCILVKMNRIIGLMPLGHPYINCTAKRDTTLMMQYFPPEGRIDKMYFPYYGKRQHPTYVQPLVAVKLLLTKEDYGEDLTVECKVEGSPNLETHSARDKFLGRVSFRVRVTE